MVVLRWQFGRISEEEVSKHSHSRCWRSALMDYGVTRYVAKVIFTYILGYKVDIGHMEAVNLISSMKYSEKQIVGMTARALRSLLT